MAEIVVKIKAAEGIQLPEYATPGASGMDVRAAEAALIPAGGYTAVGTGLYLEMPLGCEAQVRPRSGLALKHGVTVLNAPGTIDSDYRGEVRIILINHGKEDFSVEPGDRIAQIIFASVIQVAFAGAAELSETARADGGFGSTGRK